MMNTPKYDIIQWIGNKACAGMEAYAGQPACTAVEAWNMGGVILFGMVFTLVLLAYVQRRDSHRSDFFR